MFDCDSPELLKKQLMFDGDIYFMVAIFQQAYQAGEFIYDPVAYVKKYKFQIKVAGQLLEYLGLAVRDKRSPLAWRPTPDLLKIAAENLTRKESSAEPAARGEFMIDLLTHTVLGDYNDGRGALGKEMLAALGLLLENSCGWDATEQLEALFADGYYKKLMAARETRKAR
jgi:hypothetical protein